MKTWYIIFTLILLILFGCNEEKKVVVETPKVETPVVETPTVEIPEEDPNDDHALIVEMADGIIRMDNDIYPSHEKSIVKFGHKKHYTEYNASCGECHHDDKNQPLDLKEGDDVQSCAECHKKIGKLPKKLKKSQKLEYHEEALHYNCKDCHKVFNKKNKTKSAPTTCKKCHV